MDLVGIRGKVRKHLFCAEQGNTVTWLKGSRKIAIRRIARLHEFGIGGVEIVKVEGDKTQSLRDGGSWTRLFFKLRYRLFFSLIEESEVVLLQASGSIAGRIANDNSQNDQIAFKAKRRLVVRCLLSGVVLRS